MNKSKLLEKIISRLEQDIDLYYRAARASHAEATHEQSKADNKYDTRGLEAAYLAGGQARQAAEMESAISELRKLALRKFGPTAPIDLSAVVVVESAAETSHYFIAPKAGGLEVTVGRQEIFLLTPQTPLGKQLIGRKAGDKIKLQLGPKPEMLKIVSVE